MSKRSLEITAIVPTLGEKTLEESLRALRKQTLPPKKIIVIKNVMPSFSHLYNKGLSQIKTPFFTICDADVILDPDCLEVMSRFMRNNVGLVSAYLKDDLLGIVSGQHLIRRIKTLKYKIGITSASDFFNAMAKLGWKRVWAKRRKTKYRHPAHILGYHKPEYNPVYVFQKFKILGQRMLYRRRLSLLEFYMPKLKKSRHPMAFIALVAFCHGLCSGHTKYEKRPFKETKDFKLLKDLLTEGNKKGLTGEMKRYLNVDFTSGVKE